MATKYVRSDAAGGGDGSTDTNSGGTGAWTWAEMLTSAAAGDTVNVKAGTYSRTTATDAFTNDGTDASPIIVRGFNTAAGDLEANGRTGTSGALVTTNFPAITYTTGGLTLPKNAIFEHLNISGARTASAQVLAGEDYAQVRRCKITNTGSGANAHAFDGGGVGTDLACLVDCDLQVDGTNGNETCIVLYSAMALFCRCRAPNGGRGIYLSETSGAIGCQILDAGKGVTFANNNGGWLIACSFRNISGNYIDTDNSFGNFIVNNVAWGSGGSSRWFAGSSQQHLQLNNAVGNMGAADTNEGGWLVRNEVALTSDPFTSSSDLSLNNTAGGGADCKTAGIFGNDIGAIQAASAAAGGLLTHPGMAGGMRA